MPGPGDFTGRKKAELLKQQADEQKQAAAKLTTTAPVAEDRSKREVVDYATEKPAPPPEGPKDLTVDQEEDPVIARIVAGTAEPAPGVVGAPQDVVQTVDPVKPQKVLVRAKYDLKQVTVGRGTFYDFEEGQRYYVPPNAAEHLERKNLVDVL